MQGLIRTKISLLLLGISCSIAVYANDSLTGLTAENSLPAFECLIEPGETVDVGSRVPGIIDKIYADRGDLVEYGAPLVQLDSQIEQVVLELAKVRANLNVEVELQQENAAFSERMHTRNRELFNKAAISEQELDRLNTEMRVSKLQEQQAQYENHIAIMEYRRALAQLAQRTIQSPLKGVVVEKYKSVGEYVDDAPLLRIAQLDPLRVEIIVPAEYWGQLSVGRRAEVTPELYGQVAKIATVERIDPVIDSASGTFRVQLSLHNPDNRITAGVKCQLSFLPEQPDNESAGNSLKQAESVRNLFIQPETTTDNTPKISSSSHFSSASANVAELFADFTEYQNETTSNLCYALGPVTEKDTAQRIKEQLEGLSPRVDLLEQMDSNFKGYRVHTYPEQDKEKVTAIARRLEEEKVKDFYMTYDKEAERHWIFLGLYSERERAINRVNFLSDKGFKVAYKPSYYEGQKYWLRIMFDNRKDESELRESITKLASHAKVAPVICEQL